jgi:hypothetical protein
VSVYLLLGEGGPLAVDEVEAYSLPKSFQSDIEFNEIICGKILTE